ncbi:MAG: histidine kinase [Bhargavaea sp.]
MKRALKFAIPLMLIVAGLAWWYLNKEFQDVPGTHRMYITIGAGLLSGVISWFLFPEEPEDPEN